MNANDKFVEWVTTRYGAPVAVECGRELAHAGSVTADDRLSILDHALAEQQAKQQVSLGRESKGSFKFRKFKIPGKFVFD